MLPRLAASSAAWAARSCCSTAIRAAVSSTTPASAVLAGPSLSGPIGASRFSSSSVAAADEATPAQPYFIEQAPVEDTGVPKAKWGHATIKGVRGHTKKLNPVARQLKGLAVNEAAVLMAFSDQKRAEAGRAALERAARNADFYHNISSDKLIVDQAWTGKHISSPRLRYHSKGRAGRSHYRTSTLNVRLREMTPEEAQAKARFTKTLPTPDKIAQLDPRGY